MSLTIQQLTFVYPNQQPIIHHLNLTIQSGVTTLLSGPTGCGKTTLLKIIAGLLPKYGGQITAGQVNTDQFKRTAMLFQDPNLQFTMDTPRHELEFTLENLQVPPAEIAPRINQVLSRTKLTELADQPLTTLSGGQLQMVALAVTIAMQADLILLDEPFTNIDEESRTALLTMLQELQNEHQLTIIIADHDLHGYQQYVHQIVQFHDNGEGELLSPTDSRQRLVDADHEQNVTLDTLIPGADLVPAYTLNDVQINRQQRPIIKQSALMIPRNAVTLLTGRSGTGKSTLFATLCKQLPYSGQIQYQGQELTRLKPRKYFAQVGMLFQHTDDQFLNVTVKEELALSQKHSRTTFFTNERIREILHQLRLQSLMNRVVYSLSGGQKKLLQNLLMLMMGHETLLMDEPFNGLDHDLQQALIQLIGASQQQSPQTLIIISHQPQQFRQLAQYHLVLDHHELAYREG